MEPIEIVRHVNEVNEPILLDDSFNLIFWILMGANLVIFAIVRTTNNGYIRSLFMTALYNRPLNNNLSDRLDLRHFSSVFLTLTYFFALAPIIWKATNIKEHIYMLYLAIILLVLALVKMGFIALLEFVFNDQRGLQEHRLNHLIFFQIGGIILTPLMIFTHYVSADYVNLTLTIFAIIVDLLVLAREIQSLIRAIQFRISIFYIILYLCTLEIMPLMVGFRVFVLDNGALN